MESDELDKLMDKLNMNSKKGIQNLVIFLIASIIMIIMINSIFSKPDDKQEIKIIETSSHTVELSFEEKLESILSTIHGIRNVSVLIAYENTVEKVPLYDSKEITTVTEEADKNGGERKTREVNNEYTVVYEENGNQKNVLMKQNIMPKMTGIIVTAEGADSNLMKESIISAIVAVTGLSSNKIVVFGK